MMWPESAFWDYSLSLYGRPMVKPACLTLQRRHGLDVNVLLFACWLADRGVELDQGILARAKQAALPWQREIVRPLREVRDHLADRLSEARGKPESVDTRWLDRLAALRQGVLALELDGEHLVQLALDRIATDLEPTETPGIELAGRNLTCFGLFHADDLEELSGLLRQAFPATTEQQLATTLRRFER